MTRAGKNTKAAGPEEAPYGAWSSPIQATDLSRSVLGFDSLTAHGDTLYWREYRPDEDGRYVVMRRLASGETQTLTPDGVNVRTRVHEYGGAPYTIAGGMVIFASFKDQRLYRTLSDGTTEPITEEASLRYADCIADPAHNRVICVREDHRGPGEAVNTLTAIDLDTGDQRVLVEGPDFVAYPRISKDGQWLAWIAWDHPNMPWDHVGLFVARIGSGGGLEDVRRVNEGIEESVVDPQWTEDHGLIFSGDRSGWWLPYRWEGEATRPLAQGERDFGGPLWTLGARFMAALPDGRIAARVLEGNRRELIIIDTSSGDTDVIDLGGFEPMSGPVLAGGKLQVVAASARSLPVLLSIDPRTHATEIIKRSGHLDLDPELISAPEPLTYPTGDGDDAHGFYYPPRNPAFRAPEGTLPPLIVTAHGGPTGRTDPVFRLATQYWTSRGFAILDINYRGSTGYGRDYRERLYGRWGIVDVTDAVRGALYAAETGRADRNKLLVRGGSAGGFVVLAALAFHDVFAAGANYFGVSDLEALARDTHKFESRYLDQLVGPYPEMKDTYKQRSPINHLEGFNSPLIVFQGKDDKVVPPNQSEVIVEALRKKGVPVAYLAFDGEGHGFHKTENKVRSLEGELSFYGQILGFTPAGDIDPVAIDNLNPA